MSDLCFTSLFTTGSLPCSGASVSHSGPLYPIPLSLSAVYPLVTWPPLLLQCSRASLPPQQATGPPSSAAAVGSWPLFLPLPDFAAGDGRELGAAASPFCPLLSFSFFYPLIARSCTTRCHSRTVPSVQSQFRNEPAFCQSRSLSFSRLAVKRHSISLPKGTDIVLEIARLESEGYQGFPLKMTLFGPLCSVTNYCRSHKCMKCRRVSE